jgi:Chondroitinase B/Glycosyl hydrolases family 31 TIM-barrel domain
MQKDNRQERQEKQFKRFVLSFLAILAPLAFLAVKTSAAEARIDSPARIAPAARDAKPGDEIVLADGKYADADITLAAKGTAEKPITLRAQTPGKVELAGKSKLLIDGDHLVVSGFFFSDSDSDEDVVRIKGENNRLTESAIIAPRRGGKWIHFLQPGRHNRVDHCYVEGHAPQDVRLQVEVDEKVPNEHQIDHNHFAHRPPLGKNGGETFRIGYSYQSMFVSRTLVEHNLFTQCDGELEIISNKSCENVYRDNTFRDCSGTLTLRHGNRCTVENNFFFGNTAADPKKPTGGVRVIGEDHKIVGNYFERTSGINGAVINLTAGIPNSELKGYWQIKKCLVAGNAFADNDAPILNLSAGYNERNRTLLPEDVIVRDNVMVPPANGAKPLVTGKQGAHFTWENNIAQAGSKLGSATAEEIKLTDIKMVRGKDGVMRREGEKPSDNHPLNPEDVGPAWRGRKGNASASPPIYLDAEPAKPMVHNSRVSATFDPQTKELAIEFKEGWPVKSVALCDRIVAGGDVSAQLVDQANAFGTTQAIEVQSAHGGKQRVWVHGELPFLFTSVTLFNAREGTENVHDITPITFGLAPREQKELRWFGSDGLAAAKSGKTSYLFLAAVDPASRNGVVGGWITHERGSGIVAGGKDLSIAARSEYGRLQIGSGQAAAGETFAIGYFADAREGLEQFADVTAKANKINLPPPYCGYSTWYHAHASDESRMAKLAAFAKQNRLGEFGLNFLQIDDGWQVARRDFTTHKPKGPYPAGMKNTAEAIHTQGFKAGIWLTPFGWNAKEGVLAEHKDWFVQRADGSVYDVKWAGDCLDTSNPEARAFLKQSITRMTHDWGYDLLKIDGLWAGMACKILYPSPEYADDNLGDAVFHDPTQSNVQVYRSGLKLVRDAAGPDVFLLGCNIAQNMRTLGGSFGLVDAMRIGPDIKADWAAVRRCARPAEMMYFLNGRVWHNDPDCIMLRDPLTLENARAWGSFVAISGQLNLVSESLPDLPPEKLDVYKRTLPNHRNLRVRPVDLFEREMPRVWQLTSGEGESRRDVIAIFNWNSPKSSTQPAPSGPALEEPTTQAATKYGTGPITVKLDLKQLGLPPSQKYVAYDFWDNVLLDNLSDATELSLPPGSCKVLSIVPKLSHPQVVSNSRHVAQENLDLTYVRWHNESGVLEGRLRLTAGDPAELRIDAGGHKLGSVTLTSGGREGPAAKTTAQDQKGSLVRVSFLSPVTREVEWQVNFDLRGGFPGARAVQKRDDAK